MPIIFRPVTDGSLAVVYTTLADVKRILRTVPQYRIRFSNSYRDLFPRSSNSGDISLSEVRMDDDYAGSNRLVEITFSDALNFTVTMTDEGTRAQESLGSGTVSANFTASNNAFVIPATAWSGTAVANDVVSFKTDSHISNNDGLWFIQRAEIAIDSKIGSIGGAYKDIDTTTNRLFTLTTVPDIISSATAFVAAYLIFTIIFSTVMSQAEDQKIPSGVIMWQKLADGWVRDWLTREINRNSITVPLWVAEKSIFNYVGLEGIGLGVLADEQDAEVIMPEDRDDWGDDDLEYG